MDDCPSCASLRSSLAAANEAKEKAEASLRRIAGELGEFADADGETMVKKIAFLRSSLEKSESRVKDALTDLKASGRFDVMVVVRAIEILEGKWRPSR